MSAPAPLSDRSSMGRVRAALGERITQDRGDQIHARCPVPEHDDHTPSLSVTWRVTDKSGGRVFLACHRGCADAAVWEALGLELPDLYDTPPARPAGTPSPRAARPRRTPRPSAPAETGTAAAGAPKRRRPASEIEAEYAYTDPAGAVLYEIVRWRTEPKYTARRYTDAGRWTPGAVPAADRVLYNLPAIGAARASGAIVYLTEGERDAEAMIAAGVTATTAPFGAPTPRTADGSYHADGKWLPQYTAALAGAHVVIVFDNDPAEKDYPGQRYALHIAGELEGVAASVQLARAAAGKDAADHLAAGHGVAELVLVERAELAALIGAHDQAHAPTPAPDPIADADAAPAAAPERFAPAGDVIDMEGQRAARRGPRVTTAPEDDRTGGSGGGGSPRRGSLVRRDRFDVIEGSLCQIKWEASKTAGEVGQEVPHELINAAPRLARRLRHELGDGAAARVTHFDLEGEQDGVPFRLEALDDKEWSSCTWVNELPLPAIIDDTSTGRAKLRKAVVATSGPVPIETLYGRLGWWEIGGRWIYLHAAGAIDADGPTDALRVKVATKYEPFALPDPAADATQLRAALTASLIEPMDSAIPDRLIAPMLCAAYRAPLGYSRVTLVPCGSRAQGKTALAAIGQQHFAPSATYERLPFGAGELAATINSLEEHRFTVGDMLQVLDDVAPDNGTESMGKRQNALARSQAERRGKDRRTRDRAGIHPEHRPNGLLSITTEQWTGIDSAETRTIGLEVRKGEFDPLATCAPLDAGGRPMLRAVVTATLVQHYAARMPLTHWLADTRTELRTALLDPCSDPGVEARRCESFADLAVGGRALLDMAVERGAFTAEESAYWWERIWAALVEAKRAMTASREDRQSHEVALELIRAALLRKAASVQNRETGDYPEDPAFHGYDPAPGSNPLNEAWRRVGDPIGWVDEENYYLVPTSTTKVIAAEARGASITWPYTHTSLGTELANANVIRSYLEKKTGNRRTQVGVRIGPGKPGKLIRVWQLPRELLFPTVDPADGDPQDPTPDTPPAAPDPTPAPVADHDDQAGEHDQDAAADSLPLVIEAPDPGPAQPAESPADAADPLSAGITPATNGEATTEAYRPYDAPAVVFAGAVGYLARTTGQPDLIYVPELPKGAAGLPALASWAETEIHLGHPGARRGARHSYGQVWLLPGMRQRLGLPAHLPRRERGEPETKTHENVRAALEAGGWNVAGKTGVAAWTTIYRVGGRRMVLVVPEWLYEGTKVAPLGDDDPDIDARSLARRIGLYAAVAGISHQWSPAVTGVQLISATRPRLMGTDRPEPPPPARRPNLEHDFTWQRAPQPDERRKKYAHAIDKRAAYLGASASLTLGYGDPVHVMAPEFTLDTDRDVPGYWCIRSPKIDHARLPDPLQVLNRGKRETLWVTTPTMRTLVELFGVTDLQIREAYLWTPGEDSDGEKNTGRVLEPWYETLRNALLALEAVKRVEPAERAGLFASLKIKLDPVTARTLLEMAKGDEDGRRVLEAIKGNYRGGIGRLDADAIRDTGHRMWRPDFRHHVIAQSRYSLLRKIMADRVTSAGFYPLAIVTDAIVFASDEPDITKALPPGFNLGWTLGSYKPVGTALMDEVAPLLERGEFPVTTTRRKEDQSVKEYGLMDTIRGLRLDGAK